MRLPSKLVIALGQYFLGSQLSNKQLISYSFNSATGSRTEEWKDGTPWNKTESLARIDAVLPDTLCYESCAGTFWIYRRNGKGQVVEMDRDNWPKGKLMSREKKKA